MKYKAIRHFDAGTGSILPGQYYSGPCIPELLKEGCLEGIEGEEEEPVFEQPMKEAHQSSDSSPAPKRGGKKK